ncbi:hypothetical protein VMCG_04820 [Cytospora schulzeri]|uniref:Uncharacterized protein n=1 Tax=Cytospora schulzeri TaxID=448051 RepID=A0A423WMV7_9PEZI|nr:hypothetical protein VMCG_04820 [Valsa malicola]
MTHHQIIHQPFPQVSPEPTRPSTTSDGEAEEARKLTVDDLGQQHRDIFIRALLDLWSTPAAETTFAQILDGAPLSQSVQDVPIGSEGKRNNGVFCPLPIYSDQKNLVRVDPEEPISTTGIYRDLWERRPLGDNDGNPRSHCGSYNSLDYPSDADFVISRERRYERLEARLDAEIGERKCAAASIDLSNKEK